jgi:oligogalacturonide transport system substrate-binding protein
MRNRSGFSVRNLVLLALCLCVAAGAFATGKADSGTAAPTPATVRLAWWGGDTRHKATVAAAEAFMKVHPEIVVKTEYMGFEGYYDKLITQIAAGTGPDSFQFAAVWFGDVQKSPEMFYDLMTLKGLDLSGWTPTVLDTAKLNGKQIGLPLGANGRVWLYNKDLLDKAGITIDKYLSWKDWGALVAKARAGDPSIMGYSGTMDQYYYPLIAYLVQKTGKLFITKDLKFGFTEQDLVEGLKMFQQWFADGTFQALEKTVLLKASWSDPDWLNGKVLFSETPVTQIPQHLKYPYKIGITRYPMLEGAKLSGVECGPNLMFCINAKTKAPAAIAALMNYLYADAEGAKLMALERGVPTNKKGYDVLVKNDMIDDITRQAMKLIDDTDTGKYTSMEFLEIHDALWTAIEKIGLKEGQTTAEAAAKEFMAKGNAVLAKAK